MRNTKNKIDGLKPILEKCFKKIKRFEFSKDKKREFRRIMNRSYKPMFLLLVEQEAEKWFNERVKKMEKSKSPFATIPLKKFKER